MRSSNDATDLHHAPTEAHLPHQQGLSTTYVQSPNTPRTIKPNLPPSPITRLKSLALALVALTLLASPASASDMLRGDKNEQAALKSLESDKFIRAREQAEKVLKDKPDSFIGQWVLARVFHVEEANLPRALFLLRKVKKRFQERFGTQPDAALARTWHRKILMEETWIVGEMDQPEERLRLLAEYNALYKPRRDDLRMWPLMKLRRFDEARELGRMLAKSDDFNERVRGWNGLLATEAEALDRKATYDTGLQGIRATQGKSCVVLGNTSESALAVFRFDKAEELARRALKADYKDCSNTPYARLAMVYLVTGEFQSTVSAIEKVQQAPIIKRYRQQFDMANKALLTDLLYALGKFEEAEKFALEMFSMPDRGGMTSSSRDDVNLAYAVTYTQVLNARLEQERERASARGFMAGIEHLGKVVALQVERFKAKRQALRLGARGGALSTMLRPFLRPLLPFAHPAMAEVVGRGVVDKALAAARLAEGNTPEIQGYFDGIEGWLAYVDGDDDRAKQLGESALKKMPRRANLVRWRVLGWLGDVYRRQGDTTSARTTWTTLLQKQPTVFRQLGLRLPVTIKASDDDLAEEVADLLEDSPRLETDGANLGFVVDVSAEGGFASACLRDSKGYQFSCARLEPKAPDAEADIPEAQVQVADAFHDKAFSPRIELTQSDINSLDGSPMRVDADRVLQQVLGKKKKEGER